MKVLGIQKKRRTPQSRRKIIENIGPNEVVVYAVPGVGNRRVIDTTYEVDVYVQNGWHTVARYLEVRETVFFARGLAYGLRLVAVDSLSDLEKMIWEGFGG